jgi:hypothetical protein
MGIDCWHRTLYSLAQINARVAAELRETTYGVGVFEGALILGLGLFEGGAEDRPMQRQHRSPHGNQFEKRHSRDSNKELETRRITTSLSGSSSDARNAAGCLTRDQAAHVDRLSMLGGKCSSGSACTGLEDDRRALWRRVQRCESGGFEILP